MPGTWNWNQDANLEMAWFLCRAPRQNKMLSGSVVVFRTPLFVNDNSAEMLKKENCVPTVMPPALVEWREWQSSDLVGIKLLDSNKQLEIKIIKQYQFKTVKNMKYLSLIKHVKIMLPKT